MACIERTCGRRPTLAPTRAWCALTLQICALILVGSMWAPAASGADVWKARASTQVPGAQIAIADFDGDQRPDLASVETGRIGSASTDYWIQLQLTEAGRQAIHLVAPSGGLLIEARDVNGDNAVDIVLTTAWLKEPVAVFLNDGHGGFSRAEPSEFPGAFTESTGSWCSFSSQAPETAGLPPQTRLAAPPRGSSLRVSGNSTEPVRAPSIGYFSDPLHIAYAGRAPPLGVLFL